MSSSELSEDQRRSTVQSQDRRESIVSVGQVVLPHGDPVFRSGWLRVRFKRHQRSVPRFCTLTGACFKHSASPSGNVLADGFDVYGAKISSDDFSANALIIKPQAAPRITLIADNRDELNNWFADLTRACNRSIVKDYQCVQELRPAGIGNALLAVDRSSQTQVTVKLTSKRVLHPKYICMARAEAVTLLSLVNHSNILAIRDVYESARNIYLVTEYVPGHTLAEFMEVRGSVCEADISVILRDLLSALEHMHLAGAVHRMCTPDNVVLMYGEKKHRPVIGAKLCNLEFTANVFDLNSAPSLVAMFDDDGPLTTMHASYVAPEVARGDRSSAAAQDIWSIGMLMHYMLVGSTPYQDLESHSSSELLRVIGRGHRPRVVGPMWKGVTTGARQLCSRLLDPNPKTRCTAALALEDPWMTMQ